MAHGHGDGRVAIPRQTRRLLALVSIVLGIATLVGVVLLLAGRRREAQRP